METEEEINLNIWSSRVAQYTASMLAPFSSSEARKMGYTLITISSIIILSCLNAVTIGKDASILGLTITTTQPIIEILSCVCIYILILYLMDVKQELKRFSLDVLIAGSPIYYPKLEIEQLNETINKRSASALQEYDENIARIEQLSKATVKTPPDFNGLTIKEARKRQHDFFKMMEAVQEVSEKQLEQTEAEGEKLEKKLASIKKENEKFNAIFKMYDLAHKEVIPVFNRRKIIEITFPTILSLIAISFAFVKVIFNH